MWEGEKQEREKWVKKEEEARQSGKMQQKGEIHKCVWERQIQGSLFPNQMKESQCFHFWTKGLY